MITINSRKMLFITAMLLAGCGGGGGGGDGGGSGGGSVPTPTPTKVSLNVSSNSGGSVLSSPTGIQCGSTCSASYATGSIVTLTANPNQGYSFTGWGGACSGTNSCSVVMSEARNVQANFALSSGLPPISLSLVPNRISGVAPLSVFFDASASTALATNMPFHDLRYSWNFGDPAGGATWKYGTRPNVASKNIAYGGVAQHVFETPGTYTVTLTGYDGVNTASKTTTIIVTDPNVVFAGNKTVCIANGSLPVAGANGCPTGALVDNRNSLQEVADTYAKTSRRILLKRGDTWDTVSNTFWGQSDLVIGAYGTGLPPVVRIAQANNNGFTFYSNQTAINNVTLMDIKVASFNGGWGNVAGFSADFPSSNFLALRLQADGVGGIAASGSGLSVVDCELTNLRGNPANNGMGFVGVYFDNASQTAVQGNKIYDATQIEHNIRTHATKEVISNNSVYAPAPTKQAITVRGMGLNYTTAWSGNWVEHVVVSDNDVDAGPNAGWVVQLSSTSNAHDERIRDVIFERNYVHGPSGTLLISEVNERGTIRNNLFMPSDNLAYGSTTISIVHMNVTGAPIPNSHFIYNNTFYRPQNAHPTYAAVELGLGTSGSTTYPKGTIVKNNLAYAPFSTSNGYNANPGPEFFGSNSPATSEYYILANNSSAAQMKNTAPGFTTPPVTLLDWKPTSGYAIGSGANVPVWDDFFANPRSGLMDMGAVLH